MTNAVGMFPFIKAYAFLGRRYWLPHIQTCLNFHTATCYQVAAPRFDEPHRHGGLRHHRARSFVVLNDVNRWGLSELQKYKNIHFAQICRLQLTLYLFQVLPNPKCKFIFTDFTRRNANDRLVFIFW